MKTYKNNGDTLVIPKKKININICEDNLFIKSYLAPSNYLKNILDISEMYLEQQFKNEELEQFYERIKYIELLNDPDQIIKEFSKQYIKFVKEIYQRSYKRSDKGLCSFISQKDKSIKIIWGDSYNVLKSMNSEFVHLMVTSPPYYNAL